MKVTALGLRGHRGPGLLQAYRYMAWAFGSGWLSAPTHPIGFVPLYKEQRRDPLEIALTSFI